MQPEHKDPYAAPAADIDYQGALPPSRPVRGILFGALIDIFVSTLVGIGALAIYTGVLVANSADGAFPSEEVVEQAFTDLGSPMFYVMVLLGSLTSMLGGYVCARYARQLEMRYAAVLAVLIMCYVTLVDSAFLDLGIRLAMAALTVFAIFAGAWLGARRNRREEVASAGLAA